MKRILYVITNADLGGAQSHLIDLVQGFKGRWSIDVVCGSNGPMTERLLAIGIVVHILPSLARTINPLLDVLAVVRLYRMIRLLDPDLVHAHSSKAGLISRVAAFLAGVPCVFTAHGWGFAQGVPRHLQLLLWCCEAGTAPLAAKIICVSDYDERLALTYLPGGPKRFVRIYNGIEELQAKVVVHEGPPAVLMVARFSSQKDQTLLLRAFVRVDFGAKLWLVGTGRTLESCRTLAMELGVQDRVSFMGERRDVQDLLPHAQVFALISRYEGLPISILEAMRAGLPVVATRVGGVPEQVEDGVTGSLVSPGDVEALAGALRSILGDPALRERMGRASQAKFRSSFTLDVMLARTLAVYEDVLL